jgi:hypothetical protein
MSNNSLAAVTNASQIVGTAGVVPSAGLPVAAIAFWSQLVKPK